MPRTPRTQLAIDVLLVVALVGAALSAVVIVYAEMFFHLAGATTESDEVRQAAAGVAMVTILVVLGALLGLPGLGGRRGLRHLYGIAVLLGLATAALLWAVADDWPPPVSASSFRLAYALQAAALIPTSYPMLLVVLTGAVALVRRRSPGGAATGSSSPWPR